MSIAFMKPQSSFSENQNNHKSFVSQPINLQIQENSRIQEMGLSETYRYPSEPEFFKISCKEHWGKLNRSTNVQFSAFDVSEEKSRISEETNNVSYSAFEPITIKKPEPFMGAFLQTQSEFSCFNVNVKIPAFEEYTPFSRILSDTMIKFDEEKLKEEKVEQIKQKTKIGKEMMGEDEKNGHKKKEKSKGFWEDFLTESLKESIEEESESVEKNREHELESISISDIGKRPNEEKNEEEEKSAEASIVFPYDWIDNYNEEDEERKHKHAMKSVLWDGSMVTKFNHAYEFHQSFCEEFIVEVDSRIQLKEAIRRFSDEEICENIVNMFIGVETELFILDYHKLEWKFNNKLAAHFDYVLRSSFQNHLEDIFIMCNIKVRIETAIAYMRKLGFRRIMQEVALEVKEFLLILDEIGLEMVARKSSFLDFVTNFSEYKPELTLIYELLVNDSAIKSLEKSYMDFDTSYLNSEAVMYKQIIRLSNSNDSLRGKCYELSLRILKAAFKPVTFTLNRIVFNEADEISNKDETYLRYYFQNTNDLLFHLGKRIQLIKEESNELYMICRAKDEIQIVMETNQLKQYSHKWRQVFQNKKKMIEQIEKKNRAKVNEDKKKKQEERVMEIYLLKSKLLKRIEETKQRKSELYLESVEEIKRLKKDITEREEKRRLMHLIEKEQEKGFLLDRELKEKHNLIHQKEVLLTEAEKEGLKIDVEGNIGKEEEKKELVEKSEVLEENAANFTTKEKYIKRSLSNKVEIKNEEKLKQEQPKGISQRKSMESKFSNQQDQVIINKELPLHKAGSSNFEVPSDPNIVDSDNESEKEDIEEQENIMVQEEEEYEFHVSTNTVLELCIDSIVRQQIEITNQALSYLVYDRYQILGLMEFMRKIFLCGNGEALTGFLHLSVSHDSRINLQFFNECSLFDKADEFIRSLEPEFYEMHQVSDQRSEHELRRGVGIYQNRFVNIFQENVENSLGFQFHKLPTILEPYFSYIHLSKYMQIFGHIIKMKHCTNLISECLISLNECKRIIEQDAQNKEFLEELFKTRHIIHIFMNTLQSFFYYRVVEKEIKTIKINLKKRDINELCFVHLQMLDSIIKRGFIENAMNDVSKIVKSLLMDVRKFKNVVDSFCANDIHSYVRNEIEAQVSTMKMNFRKRQEFFESLFYHH